MGLSGMNGGEVRRNNESDDARQHFDRRELHGHRLRESIKTPSSLFFQCSDIMLVLYLLLRSNLYMLKTMFIFLSFLKYSVNMPTPIM